MKARLDVLGKEVFVCKNRGDIVETDRFVGIMEQFHKEAMDSFCQVEGQFRDAERLFEECLRYFGEEDVKKVTMDAMTACLRDFVVNFEMALVDEKKQRERREAVERRRKPEKVCSLCIVGETNRVEEECISREKDAQDSRNAAIGSSRVQGRG